MKELSVEEKAQRYDKAVESLRAAFYDDNNRMCEEYRNAALKIIEPIFPELAESEDEKIKKALIKLVKKAGEGYENVIDGVSIENAISWLENQGEHKKFRDSIQVGDKVTRNEEGVLVNLSQLNRVAKKDEKQGEHKPAWNKEDTEHLNSICATLKEKANEKPFDMPSYYDKQIDWLKSLKDRVIPQPKQEWSEEDEYKYNTILHHLDLRKEKYKKECNQEEQDRYQGLYDFLKSLKERYTWKPSDEQMDALNYVVNLMASSERPTENDLYYNILKSLRQQLMKLKE